MNKYLVPICDIQAGSVYNKIIIAKSLIECQDKLVQYLIEKYDDLYECLTYHEFIELADKNDILVGNITDIETI